MNSRDVMDLETPARLVCAQHIGECRSRGIELLVTSTWRDIEAQNGLYAIGRTVNPERRIVTNAKGGKSWHNYRCAWDVVPLIGGKCVWDPFNPVWKEVVAIGKNLGAEAGADWPKFPDLPHFQVTPKALTLEVAFERFTEQGTIFV